MSYPCQTNRTENMAFRLADFVLLSYPMLIVISEQGSKITGNQDRCNGDGCKTADNHAGEDMAHEVAPFYHIICQGITGHFRNQG